MNKDFQQGFSTPHTPHRNDLNKDFQQGFSTRHTPHRNDPHSNDLNKHFPLRIGSVAGDSYPGAIPVHMADKTVLAMKVASDPKP